MKSTLLHLQIIILFAEKWEADFAAANLGFFRCKSSPVVAGAKAKLLVQKNKRKKRKRKKRNYEELCKRQVVTCRTTIIMGLETTGIKFMFKFKIFSCPLQS